MSLVFSNVHFKLHICNGQEKNVLLNLFVRVLTFTPLPY